MLDTRRVNNHDDGTVLVEMAIKSTPRLYRNFHFIYAGLRVGVTVSLVLAVR